MLNKLNCPQGHVAKPISVYNRYFLSGSRDYWLNLYVEGNIKLKSLPYLSAALESTGSLKVNKGLKNNVPPSAFDFLERRVCAESCVR